MSNEVTLGGERLGGGKKMKVHLHNYERSTHNLSHVLRTTMSPGTLVPFLKQVALPGDTFDIELNADVMTSPTIGPLFGSFQLQCDVFVAPIRLYQAMLHMNMLGIGMDMSKVKLPLIEVETRKPSSTSGAPDNLQINPSALLKYLGISGLGSKATGFCTRRFNGIPYLAYWDIYKNYYANKQENIGVYVHAPATIGSLAINSIDFYNNQSSSPTVIPLAGPDNWVRRTITTTGRIVLSGTGITASTNTTQYKLRFQSGAVVQLITLSDYFSSVIIDTVALKITWSNPTSQGIALFNALDSSYMQIIAITPENQLTPQLFTFPLTNIDTMRTNLLQANQAVAYVMTRTTPNLAPYNTILDRNTSTHQTSGLAPQEGLAVRTYKSDLYNNWLSTEWISGVNGIAEITKISTASGGFTIDELTLSRKIYDMLNRIAVSGGSYDDWLDAVYKHDRQRSAENPMYMGGLIKNIVFQEVISNAATENEPLGTLAGRGKMGNMHKGGKVVIKVDEPSYIIGICSIVPNIDYSTGNDWDVRLKTMNDLHKPALDQIGFQDLITDQMAWWDSRETAVDTYTLRSAGKQPAWINYMTETNKIKGNFAIQNEQMFMVLARRYGVTWAANEESRIADLTTYIDPAKFNNIFADTRLDAMNFWVQIGMDITARRKMSAKIMPNL